MKHKSFLTKILAVLLAAAFFTASPAHIVALATGNSQSDEYAGMTAEEKQAAIEQKIKELDSKLSSLGKESKETEEYINALDEKISYLKKQLEYSEIRLIPQRKKLMICSSSIRITRRRLPNLQRMLQIWRRKMHSLSKRSAKA